MITGEQRKAAFIADYNDLMRKHGAEAEIVNTSTGEQVEITMYAVYNNTKDVLEKDFCEFRLAIY